MDPELQKRIDQARAEGYSDDEINAALGSTPTQQATMPNDIKVPILSAEEKAQFNKNEQQVSDRNTGEQVTTGLGTLGMGAAAVGVPAALYYGGKAVLSPTVRAGANAVQQGMDLAQRGVGAMEQQAKTATMTEERLQKRPGFGGQQVRSVAPAGVPTYNVPTQTVPQMRTPVVPQGPVSTGPVIPGASPAPITAPAGPAPSLLDKTTNMIRQLAANKVMGTLAKGANVLGGAQIAAYSPELGPKTPQVGRMRGMEINPLTSRPWTPEQIRQYEANPTMFDQQMAQPQMRR
jgi:hypothetical protein